MHTLIVDWTVSGTSTVEVDESAYPAGLLDGAEGAEDVFRRLDQHFRGGLSKELVENFDERDLPSVDSVEFDFPDWGEF